MFISEIIGTLVYLHFMIKQFRKLFLNKLRYYEYYKLFFCYELKFASCVLLSLSPHSDENDGHFR